MKRSRLEAAGTGSVPVENGPTRTKVPKTAKKVPLLKGKVKSMADSDRNGGGDSIRKKGKEGKKLKARLDSTQKPLKQKEAKEAKESKPEKKKRKKKTNASTARQVEEGEDTSLADEVASQAAAFMSQLQGSRKQAFDSAQQYAYGILAKLPKGQSLYDGAEDLSSEDLEFEAEEEDEEMEEEEEEMDSDEASDSDGDDYEEEEDRHSKGRNAQKNFKSTDTTSRMQQEGMQSKLAKVSKPNKGNTPNMSNSSKSSSNSTTQQKSKKAGGSLFSHNDDMWDD